MGKKRTKKESFKDRLIALMEGEKPYTWARKVGIEKGLFQYYWQREKIPTYNNLLKIQRHTGCSLDWLLTGKRVAGDQLTGLLFEPSSAPVNAAQLERIAAGVIRMQYDGDRAGLKLLEEVVARIAPKRTSRRRVA